MSSPRRMRGIVPVRPASGDIGRAILAHPVHEGSSMPKGGPTSHIYFSQRLRLHYVAWGDRDAPPLLLVHGGRDHCRNWDWVAEDLRNDYHIIAPDLRGHGDSEWLKGGGYTQLDYVYDIAQLLNQTKMTPVTIIGHSLGGSISLNYTGLYPENVVKLVAIEGMGPPPQMLQDAQRAEDARAHPRVDQRAAQNGRPHAASLRLAGRSVPPDAGREPASVGRSGAASDDPRQQSERGRHVQLEVRQLRARVLSGEPVATAEQANCTRASRARHC